MNWDGVILILRLFTCGKWRSFSSSAAVAPDVSSSPAQTREAPWAAGLRAARANLLPGLIVQGSMLAILCGYYFYPPLAEWLNTLAEIKLAWSYGYSAVSAIIAGALIPELMRVFVFQKGRVRSVNPRNLLFTIPYWATMGVTVDFFYRCQAVWFGDQASFSVVIKKVMVDQFAYNPLFAAPVCAWLYDWKNRGYPRSGLGEFFTLHYYRNTVLPLLFATWGVWLPLVTILYSMPSTLQIPLFALALTMWVLILTWMSEQRVAASAQRL